MSDIVYIISNYIQFVDWWHQAITLINVDLSSSFIQDPLGASSEDLWSKGTNQ